MYTIATTEYINYMKTLIQLDALIEMTFKRNQWALFLGVILALLFISNWVLGFAVFGFMALLHFYNITLTSATSSFRGLLMMFAAFSFVNSPEFALSIFSLCSYNYWRNTSEDRPLQLLDTLLKEEV